jgi:hypothetical protein
MNTLDLLKTNLHVAHYAFSGTMADVTQAMADWVPPGVALPIGERWAHTIAAEDWLVHQIAQGGEPWLATSWAGKSGFGTATPYKFGFSTEEARTFRVDDLAAVREYEKAVFSSSEEYLTSLDEQALEREFDMSFAGMGKYPAPVWWSTFIIGHLHDVMGEISVLKGCLGYKGYPF